MSQLPTKRNPLSGAPSSQEIMTGARRRQSSSEASKPSDQNAGMPAQQLASETASQHNGTPVRQHDSKPESQHAGIAVSQNTGNPVRPNAGKPASQQAVELPKRKATFYISPDILKTWKRKAVMDDTNQSQMLENAMREYLAKRTAAGVA